MLRCPSAPRGSTVATGRVEGVLLGNGRRPMRHTLRRGYVHHMDTDPPAAD
jgi:hypothetical protein